MLEHLHYLRIREHLRRIRLHNIRAVSIANDEIPLPVHDLNRSRKSRTVQVERVKRQRFRDRERLLLFLRQVGEGAVVRRAEEGRQVGIEVVPREVAGVEVGEVGVVRKADLGVPGFEKEVGAHVVAEAGENEAVDEGGVEVVAGDDGIAEEGTIAVTDEDDLLGYAYGAGELAAAQQIYE